MTDRPLSVTEALRTARLHHQAGRFPEAETLYRRILDSDPRQVDALHWLGQLAAQTGRPDIARALVEQAILIDQRQPAFSCSLGDVLQEQGLEGDSEQAYRAALRLDPSFAAAHFGLGNLKRRQRQTEAAIAAYQAALRAQPRFPEALSNLGNLYRAQGDWESAKTHLQQALAMAPSFVEARYNLATLLEAMGDLDGAVLGYEQTLRQWPRFADAWYNLGNLLERRGDRDGARRCLRHALTLAPDFPEAAHNLGLLQLADGDLEDVLAIVMAQPRQNDELLALKGDALIKLGRLDEASAAFESAICAAPPGRPRYYRGLSRLRRFEADDPHLATLQKMALAPDQFPEDEQVALHFALGKAYDDLGQSEQGFAHYRSGNALIRKDVPYDEGACLGELADIATLFDTQWMSRPPMGGDPSDAPVFIVGMPRSGSTLVEQILGSHPLVTAVGERNDLDQLARAGAAAFPACWVEATPENWTALGTRYLSALRGDAPNAARIVDKMPSNFRWIGLIHRCLPHARIIHTRRDPVDTCLSCFTNHFAEGAQPFSNDLGELGRYWRAYDRLMAHWQSALPPGHILDVHYEEVVADLEGQARRIIAFLGLTWDDACLQFHQTKRPVLTASAAQVRRPLYRSSVGRWQPYREQLQPLLDALFT